MRRVPAWRGQSTLYGFLFRRTLGLQLAVLGLGLALPPLAVMPLVLQSRMIDDALPTGDLALLAWLGGLYAAAMLARAGLKFAVVYLRGRIAEIVIRCLRLALIDAQRRRTGRPARRALGVVTSVLTTEVEPVGGFAAEALNTPLIMGGTLAGVLGFMLVSEPRLAAIAAIALAIEAVMTPLVQRRINRLTDARIRALRHAGGQLIEAAGPGDNRRLVGSLADVRRAYRLRLAQALLKSGLKVGLNLVDHSADIAVLVVGILMVMRGETEIGIVVAFLAGLREMRGPWGQLIGFYRRLSDTWIKFRLVEAAVFRGPAAGMEAMPDDDGAAVTAPGSGAAVTAPGSGAGGAPRGAGGDGADARAPVRHGHPLDPDLA